MPRLRTLTLAATAALLLVGGLPAAEAARAAGADPASRAPRSDVSVSFRLGEFSAGGRVTSSRASCERNKGVVLLGQDDKTGAILGDESYVTDREGRWGDETSPARGSSASAVALVPGSRLCDIAQSQRRPLATTRRAPANVRVSFRLTERAASGRVTSTDRSCVRRVRVVFLTRSAGQSWQYGELSVRTDREGRYRFNQGARAGARGGGGTAIAVVLAGRGCDVAQSPAQGR